MAQKVNEAMLAELGLNPFAARMLAESYVNLMANNIGQVGAVEFQLVPSGVIISLRHPAHVKIVEGLPEEVIEAGVIQRFIQLAELATKVLNRVEGLGADRRMKLNILLGKDGVFLIEKMDNCYQAIKENDPDLIRTYVPPDEKAPDPRPFIDHDGPHGDGGISPKDHLLVTPDGKIIEPTKEEEPKPEEPKIPNVKIGIAIDGHEYTTHQVMDLRNHVISLRDEALKSGVFEYAVSLSHVIAILHELVANVKDEPRSNFDQGSQRDEDLVNTQLWRNSEGNPIPEWLQGRGTGVAGTTLYAFNNAKELLTIQPEQLILYRMDTKDIYPQEEPDA